MKKFLGILVLGLLWCNLSFAGVAGGYKHGKGSLKVTKNIADILEYYFSGGKMGKYARKQKEKWIGELIVISIDGRHEFHYVTPTRYQHNIAPGHYVGKARKECKKKSGKECFVFASRNRIVWDNGSDKKKRRLKKKDIMAGKTFQILQELGFYDGGITQTKKIEKSKAEKKKEPKKKMSGDVVQQLKDLNELYKSGALTKEEFEKAKKKLLD